MYNEGFRSIADTYPLGLGVYDDGNGLVQVSFFVHIYMAVSCTGLNDRYCGILHNRLDEPCSASWDQHINIAVHLHELCSNCPVGIFYQLNRILCDAKV